MKKKLAVYSMLMLIAVIAFVACGGGGGGVIIPGTATEGTFTKELGGTGLSTWSWPFSKTGEARFQTLLLANSIDGSGYIHSISFKRQGDTVDTTCPSYTIRMGHTTLAALTTTYDSNVQQGAGSISNVIDGATVSVPAGSGGEYFDIALDTPFYYNGQDNLVVELVRAQVCDQNIIFSASAVTPAYDGLLVSQTALAATGSINAARLDMRLNFTGGVGAVGEDGTNDPNYAPFSNLELFWNKAQNLYDAAIINGSGRINGLAYKVANTGGSVNTLLTVTVKMAHMNTMTLSETFADNYAYEVPVTVADAVIVNVPAGIPQGEYFWIPLPDGTFNYNGKDNLLIETVVHATNADLKIDTTNSGLGRVYGAVDATIAIGSVTDAATVRLRFKGGTLDVMPSPTISTTVFGGGAQTRQYMFRATELGTAGMIDKLACRLNSGTTLETTFSNFEAKLETTGSEQLDGGSTSANSPNPTNVYSGDFVLPADLIAGDWIEIPFSTPYVYDGKGNLIVTLSNDGSGGNSYTCRNSTADATRYPKQLSDQGGGGYNIKGVMRFFLKQ